MGVVSGGAPGAGRASHFSCSTGLRAAEGGTAPSPYTLSPADLTEPTVAEEGVEVRDGHFFSP